MTQTPSPGHRSSRRAHRTMPTRRAYPRQVLLTTSAGLQRPLSGPLPLARPDSAARARRPSTARSTRARTNCPSGGPRLHTSAWSASAELRRRDTGRWPSVRARPSDHNEITGTLTVIKEVSAETGRDDFASRPRFRRWCSSRLPYDIAVARPTRYRGPRTGIGELDTRDRSFTANDLVSWTTVGDGTITKPLHRLPHGDNDLIRTTTRACSTC